MRLRSTTCRNAPTPQIAADVKSRLQWDIWVNGDMTNVEVSGGRVTLTGVVGSAIAKSRASDDSWVNGVAFGRRQRAESRATGRTMTRAARLKYATRSDSDIKQAVQAALRTRPACRSPFSRRGR